MRPALRAGLLPLWRDRDTIQIGVDPRRGVALAGAGAAAAVIELLDGSRDRAQVITAAAELGVPAPLAERMLALLAAAGVLIDFPAGTVRTLPSGLLPELASASLARRAADGGGRILARRRAATVRVCPGAAQPGLGAAIAEALIASGVTADCEPLSLAGLSSAARGEQPPTLVILTGLHPPERVIGLLRSRVSHLAVSAGEAIGSVGPLVRPGATSCLRCLDLARAERDPAWPLLLAQLGTRAAVPVACDAVLTLAVTAQAAARALDFIDCPELAGPAENATLELVQPGWQWRRRTWRPHPACICRASEAA